MCKKSVVVTIATGLDRLMTKGRDSRNSHGEELKMGMSRLLLKFVQQALLVEQATQPWPSVQGRG